ncbi:MAG: phosphatase PAP2 family protein [Clostridia bacterium]|nr:phosphatase PAP2 family protein [Clostridia bacterium]
MELTILRFFENLRSDFATFLAILLSLFGETLFLVVLICLIYWIFSKKLGERLVIVSFSSMTLNGFLKNAVARPRPFVGGGVTRVEVDNALISTIELAPYESFPSGHSQMSAGLFFTGAFHFKKIWGWILFPLLTLGVMWSRLYFGVHYPTDVLFGATLGIAFSIFWEFFFQAFEKKKRVIYYTFAAFAALSIVFSCILPSKSLIELCACACAAAICLPIENKFINFQDAKGWKNKLFRALIGVGCVGLVYGLFSFLPFAFLELWGWKFVKYFLTVTVASLVVPYFFKKLKI